MVLNSLKLLCGYSAPWREGYSACAGGDEWREDIMVKDHYSMLMDSMDGPILCGETLDCIGEVYIDEDHLHQDNNFGLHDPAHRTTDGD